MWETKEITKLDNFNLECECCKSKNVIIKQQVYLDQGYYPTHHRKVIKCNDCGKEEII